MWISLRDNVLEVQVCQFVAWLRLSGLASFGASRQGGIGRLAVVRSLIEAIGGCSRCRHLAFRVTVPVWTNWYCWWLKRVQFTS